MRTSKRTSVIPSVHCVTPGGETVMLKQGILEFLECRSLQKVDGPQCGIHDGARTGQVQCESQRDVEAGTMNTAPLIQSWCTIMCEPERHHVQRENHLTVPM